MVEIPEALGDWALALKDGGREIEYRFDSEDEGTGVPALLKRMGELGIAFHDLNTRQSSLEEIFVSLVSERPGVRQ
jgi:ABC-2 type transport system ATP-binding protein